MQLHPESLPPRTPQSCEVIEELSRASCPATSQWSLPRPVAVGLRLLCGATMSQSGEENLQGEAVGREGPRRRQGRGMGCGEWRPRCSSVWPGLGGEPRCILRTVPSQAGRAFSCSVVHTVIVLYFQSVGEGSLELCDLPPSASRVDQISGLWLPSLTPCSALFK